MRLSSLSSTRRTVFPLAVMRSLGPSTRVAGLVSGAKKDRLQLLKPQFPYHVGTRESANMSFAGPILRRARSRGNGSMLTEPSDGGPLASSARNPAVAADRPNGALILVAGIAIGALLGAAAALL